MGIIPLLTVILLVLYIMGKVSLQIVFAPLLVWLVFALVNHLMGATHWRKWW
jgi:hypothetical protein